MKYVIISAIAILTIFLLVLTQIPLGIEPLTELYFENHTSLKADILSNTEYNFSFTIHNLEYQRMRYYYNISAFDTNGEFLFKINSGEVFLKDNETATFLEKYKLPKGFERAKISITINKDHLDIIPDFKKKLWWPDPNYPNKIDIHFWVNEI